MSHPLEWPLVKKSDRRTIVTRAVPLGLPILCVVGYIGSDDGMPLWLGALACVVLVAALVELASALRYRLEIGDEGIRQRRLREDVRVPWDDVAAVNAGSRSEVILVQRRDGTYLPLKGLSGKEALVTAMRERAGHSK